MKLQHEDVANVAAIIAGKGNQPVWLKFALCRMGMLISSFREAELSAPKRVQMRKRLERFRDAALLVREEISDPLFQVFLSHAWLSSEIRTTALVDALEKLGERVNETLPKFKGRAGNKRAYPVAENESISAMVLCAWTVRQAMQRTRGVVVGPDREDAQEAANALWQLCGGEPLGDDDGTPPTGWREHIISAQEAETANDRRSHGLRSLATGFEAIGVL